MSSNPTRDKLLLNDKVGKNKKADRTTTAIRNAGFGAKLKVNEY